MNAQQRIEELEMIREELGSLIERLEAVAKGDKRQAYYEAYLIPSLKIACGEMGFSDQDANLSTWIEELAGEENDDPEGLMKLVDELENQIRWAHTMDPRSQFSKRQRLENEIMSVINWSRPISTLPSWLYDTDDLPEIRRRVEEYLTDWHDLGQTHQPEVPEHPIDLATLERDVAERSHSRFPGQTQNFSSAAHPHAQSFPAMLKIWGKIYQWSKVLAEYHGTCDHGYGDLAELLDNLEHELHEEEGEHLLMGPGAPKTAHMLLLQDWIKHLRDLLQ